MNLKSLLLFKILTILVATLIIPELLPTSVDAQGPDTTIYLPVIHKGDRLSLLGVTSAGVIFTDINPDRSTQYQPTSAFGASGGRVNGLASVAGNNQVFYAASEWGGVYTTIDAGEHWHRLDRHLPVATWDVEVDPINTNIVYATSFYDGRVTPLSGIEVSYDKGNTWVHPATAAPKIGQGGNTNTDYSCPNDRIAEPSAFGIAIQPDVSQNVYIGTNCGLAISHNSGATWRFVDPTPGTDASDIWDVVAQPGGIIDVCGEDGHYRSLDGGNTWPIGGNETLPRGRCSIAVSPDESYVIFVADDRPEGDPVHHFVWESDDSGLNWTNLGKPYPAQAHPKRLPFLVTNDRSASGGEERFDLWYGEQDLWRVSCRTPATPQPGGSPRCQDQSSSTVIWVGPFSEGQGAHGDSGDLVFNRTVGIDACPMIYSSDGGVYRNTDLGADCQNPDFTQPDRSPHALWLWGMAGSNLPGDIVALHFGAQDDGQWASPNAQDTSPNWSDGPTSDSFTHVADADRVVWLSQGTFPRRTALHLQGTPGTPGGPVIPTPADLIDFRFTPTLDQFGDKKYVIATISGIFITNDITAGSIQWDKLGTAPAGVCGVRASVDPITSSPTFYVQVGTAGSGSCNQAIYDTVGDQLWKFTGTNPGDVWQRIDNGDVVDTNGMTSAMTGGIGIFGVDPNNPSRLYVSNLDPAGPQMVFSEDGGNIWHKDVELDEMMTGGGVFKYLTQRGPANDTGFGSLQDFPIADRRVGFFSGYPQPSLVAFDPEDSDIIVAGGRDSGIFLSTNGGVDWGLLTDPFDSGNSGIPHLPRPWFAHFYHDSTGTLWLYIGTQGRGVWRIQLRLPVAEAGGPYVTMEGTNVVLDASGSSHPDGQRLTFAWDLDNDGDFDDANGPNPIFNMVGQDGVFTVRVKVSAGGAFAVASATVTVNNVAPAIATLSSDGPKPENTPIMVDGAITDPGWLESLTATIDWGDGTLLETVSGTLENVRPDATLTFSMLHIYGDNGTFTATVCGSDDDTTTCQQIALQVNNVAPTAAIDETGSSLFHGIPTFMAHTGEPLDFSGRSTDPGSDDLTLSWDWDDGPPAPDVTTTYLVNPPDPDPFPSPSVQPRDITDEQTQAFADACLYEISFLADDDDGDHGEDQAFVIITGNAAKARSEGYWQHQYSGNGNIDFDQKTLECYLAIVNFMSTVFNEKRDASTVEKAYDVLFLKQNQGSETEQFDRELLTVWLNFANGALEFADIHDVVSNAEGVRLGPNATNKEIREQTKILQQLNH